jgi:hypothetical protein
MHEDYIPLDNLKGGNQNYDKLLHLSDTGYMGVLKKESSSTDIFKIYFTANHGWQSRYIFSVPKEIKKMTVDKDRFILDYEVYNI